MTSRERHEARYQRRKQKRLEKRALRTAEHDRFENLTDTQKLYRSYVEMGKAIKWKMFYQLFGMSIVPNIYNIIDILEAGAIVTDGYKEFTICERGKTRHIQSPSVREKVVQKTLCNYILKPVLIPTLIYDNGASLKGKGVDFARKRLVRHLSEFYRRYGKDGYVLTLDIHNYFASINHAVMLAMNFKYIKNPRVQSVIAQYTRLTQGMGIGNEMSQIEAVFYANPIDHWIKDRARMRWYGRYMDDSYIIAHTREELEYCLAHIQKLCAVLRLTLNEKKVRIIPLSKGFTFLKTRFQFVDSGKVLRCSGRESAKRERHKLRAFSRNVRDGIMTSKQAADEYKSWRKSMLKHFDCWKYIRANDKLYMEVLFYDAFHS